MKPDQAEMKEDAITVLKGLRDFGFLTETHVDNMSRKLGIDCRKMCSEEEIEYKLLGKK